MIALSIGGPCWNHIPTYYANHRQTINQKKEWFHAALKSFGGSERWIMDHLNQLDEQTSNFVTCLRIEPEDVDIDEILLVQRQFQVEDNLI